MIRRLISLEDKVLAKNYVEWIGWMYTLFWILYIFYFIFLSSPFLVCVFVYGDDRVIRYTGADVGTGDAEDDQTAE